MFCLPTKDPDEVLDYQFDWGTYRLEDGETITASVVEVTSGDVVIDSDSETDTIVTVWLSGGSAGTTSIITNRITTSASRTYEESARLRVRNS